MSFITRGYSRFATTNKVLRAAVESLEIRRLLCADHQFIEENANTLPRWVTDGIDLSQPLSALAKSQFSSSTTENSPTQTYSPQNAAPGQSNGTGNWGGGLYGAASTTFSKRADGLPILNSLIGAPFSVFLDFDGWTGSGYGGQQTHTAFDLDGDSTTFNSTEQAEIAEGWRRMASFMAPFNVNVTTVQPTSTQKNWSWSVIGNSGGGYSWGQLGSFAPSAFNGSADLLNRFSGVLHEMGHNFGLGHQGTYDDLGNRIREYRFKMDSIHGVIMGVDYDGYPSKWVAGHRGYQGNDPINVQDDVAVITGKIIPFDVAGADGFRKDDYSNTATGATALTVGGATRYGVIERLNDSDYFTFNSTGGAYKLTLTPDSPSSLDGKLDLYDSSGNIIASNDATGAVDASVTLQLPAGKYYAVARGHTNYDDIGSYAINITTATAGTSPTYNGLAAPTGLTVTQGTGTDLSIKWNTATGATGYTVEQSLDGVTYTTLTTTTSTSAIATNLAGSARYFYRISTNNASGKSIPSKAISQINRPSAVAGFRVASFDATHLVLDWVETTGETGYKIERSTNGNSFSQIATVVANGVSYTDTAVTSGATYFYRVTPTSTIGDGVVSPIVSQIPSVGSVTGLSLTNKTTTTITLAWTDGLKETGYRIERSLDGATYTTLTTTAADIITYIDTGLKNGTTYYYRVTAMNGTTAGMYQIVSGKTTAGSNNLPVAQNDSANTVDTLAVTINALSNDTDADNDPLSITSFTQGSLGTVTLNANKTFTYKPNTDRAGADSFTYTISDGKGGTSTATVNITIKGVVARWTFDENTGTSTSDASGNGHTGTLTSTSWTSGVTGSALAFNGSSSKVLFGNGPAIGGSADFSVMTWIKTTSTATGIILQQRDNPGYNGEYQVSINGGKVGFFLFGNGAQQFSFASTTTINDGLWHQIAAVRQGVTGSIYIDGVLSGTATGDTAKALDATITLSSGYDQRDNVNYLNATLDDLTIYNRVVTAADFAPINQAPTIATPASSSSTTTTTNQTVHLSVLGTDIDNAESTLKYTWTVSGPTGVTFSSNSTNASKNTTATFTQTGTYVFTATIADPSGATTTSSVTVQVNPVPATKPAMPTKIKGTVQTGKKILINWLDNATNEKGFYIQISTNAGTTWKTISTVAALTGSGLTGAYTTAAYASGTYYVRVVAYNSAGSTYGVKSKVVIS